MAVAETAHANHHDDHHGDHQHGEFIAHHFDNAEQQFDSGKLGIWVFLVTEVLFFSGLFVAYTLWRFHHPDIFEQAHVFLDKYLGALNTIVLLFSSLTIAWAVRSAQLGRNGATATLTLITMICATMFLGVKAVEYSHKWDMGILVRSAFDMQNAEAKYGMWGLSQYLINMSLIPAILLVVFGGLSATMALMSKPVWAKFWGGMVVTVAGYFLGVLIGHYYMELTGQGHGDDHASKGSATMVLMAKAPIDDVASSAPHADDPAHSDADHAHGAHGVDPSKFNRDVGIFFSIYYCMTGLHAIHIIGGVVALAWIFYRSLAGHWRTDYFGPVDYVGLYWHLVDLIWIYLFPMLYLIE